MQQNMVSTLRNCNARHVPSGETSVIPAGEFITITQDLGGNYTVKWRGNLLRIDGLDADAIGREPITLEFEETADSLIKEKHVWQALESVFDPEIPINLVSLGLIYEVGIDHSTRTVTISMTLTAPVCGMGPVLVGDVEARVAMVPHVSIVNVNLVFDPPWSKEMMSEEAQLEAGLFF